MHQAALSERGQVEWFPPAAVVSKLFPDGRVTPTHEELQQQNGCIDGGVSWARELGMEAC